MKVCPQKMENISCGTMEDLRPLREVVGGSSLEVFVVNDAFATIIAFEVMVASVVERFNFNFLEV
jgi:hypothetical protein